MSDQRIHHPKAQSPGPSAQRPDRSCLERQRILLRWMLEATREQRRHLIEGNLRGIEATNRRLCELIGEQQRLRLTGLPEREAADREAIAELLVMAGELQRESRVNYTLACRGAELARYSAALLGAPHDSLAGEPGPPAEGRPQVINRPA